MPICARNSHPFERDGWLFAHNGGLKGCSLPEGLIDSEYFFRLILDRVEESDWEGVHSAIESARETVIETCESHSSLTLFLSDGDFLYAYREFIHPKHEDYYTLFHTPYKGGWLISSEPVDLPSDSADWKPLRNRELGAFGPRGMDILLPE
jgi:predicted glutamine amidotransferase